jgi:hypothetical protein
VEKNWNQTQRRFVDWWDRKGLLVGMWGAPETSRCIHETVLAPVKPAGLRALRQEAPHFRTVQVPLDPQGSVGKHPGPGINAAGRHMSPGRIGHQTNARDGCVERLLTATSTYPAAIDSESFEHTSWHDSAGFPERKRARNAELINRGKAHKARLKRTLLLK